MFVTYADHHHDYWLSFWWHAPVGAQQALVRSDLQRFSFRPTGASNGWIGIYLDVDSDDAFWDEIAELVEDACRWSPHMPLSCD